MQVLTSGSPPYYARIPHLHNVQNIVVWQSDDARIAPPRLFYVRAHERQHTYTNAHALTMERKHVCPSLIVYDGRVDINIFRRVS